MSSDFSRTLALLRKEKRISQRTAAGDLGVSQALLSHYENGLREPGLPFVVRAANYYGVSCDYLLGRSMARDGSAVPSSHKDTQGEAEQENGQLVRAAALLLQLAEQTGSAPLLQAASQYLSIVIYKAYRYIYMADPSSVEAVFRTPRWQFEYLCDARMKELELRLRTAAQNAPVFSQSEEGRHRPPFAPSEISVHYPEASNAFLTVLQQVSDSIDTLGQRIGME